MIDNKEFFSDLEEKDLHMHIEMGDDGRYRVPTLIMLLFKGIMVLLSH